MPIDCFGRLWAPVLRPSLTRFRLLWTLWCTTSVAAGLLVGVGTPLSALLGEPLGMLVEGATG